MITANVTRHVLRAFRSQTPITVRNALLRGCEKEALSTRHESVLKWYSCGPTVYDDAHLGHARAYVSFDIIRRIITSLTGIHIDYVLGVTDIDDKILQRASERGVSSAALATQFENRFFEDMNVLNVLPPTKIVRVTEHMNNLQIFIEDLIRSGAAYSTETGNVYFAVATSGDRYGQLDPSRGSTENTEPLDVDRENEEQSEKRDPRDFALWKRAQLNDGTDRVWDSPWGKGRPGWHIECSAMAMNALGPYLDLHTGGIDLRFPHHTNELATAEAKLCAHNRSPDGINGIERWSNTWLHAGHLHLRGRKMSKSVKNFITVREFFEQGGTADAFRTFCLLHKYSSPVEYSDDRLADAQSYIARIRRFVGRESAAFDLHSGADPSMYPRCPHAMSLEAEIQKTRLEIDKALTDDFDTPQALAKVSKLVTAANCMISREGEWFSGAAALTYASACRLVRDTLVMFGISADTFMSESGMISGSADASSITEAYVKFRAGIRGAARKKDFSAIMKLCDGARDEALTKFGIRIADRKDGTSSWSTE